ncbi:AfsR/SARP family transcriptional regulator [Actinokineospora sp. 24-640]
MMVRLLGEVAVRVGTRPVDLGHPRQRCLLAALAVEAGRVVPVDRLVERVWGADVPRRGRATLYSYVSRLRQALTCADTVTIERRSGGYALLTSTAEPLVDLHLFRKLCASARADADAEQAARSLTDALELWQGEALTGLDGEWACSERDQLAQERLAAQRDLADARLRTGHGGQLVAELAAHVASHPLDERIAGQYMLALHQAGRPADALKHYRQVHARLAEELGTDPGAALRDVHRRLLAGAPDSPGDSAEPVPCDRAPERDEVCPDACRPRQLPPRAAHLIGRDALIAAVADSVRPAADAPPPVAVLVGQGGIGKTALALAVGSAVSPRFPDGQIFVDLRGARPDPVDPHTVTGNVLRALGVDGTTLPADRDERTAVYRSHLADRAVLLVLDDAAGEEQVRPLLPGTGRCAAVVTSRRQLGALLSAARHPVPLLDEPDSVALLARIAGGGRAAAEPAAAREVVRLCGNLPLAVCVAAARLAITPHQGVEEFRELLADERARLDELAVGDLDVRASIALGYRTLTPDARTLLRALGLVAAPDWPRWVAEELFGRPLRRVLDQLVETHLVECTGRDAVGQARYRLHDLVADFARERAAQDDGVAACDKAVTRPLEGWLALAAIADERVPHGTAHAEGLPAPPPPAGAPRAVAESAAEWFEAERHSLGVAVDEALRLDLVDLAGHLVLRMSGFLTLHAHDTQRETLLRRVVGRVRERGGDSLMLRLLPAFYEACNQLDLTAELPVIAAEHLALARRLADRGAEVVALWQAGRAARLTGRLDAARRWLEEAVRHARAPGIDPLLVSSTLSGLAYAHLDLGRPERALPLTEEAIALVKQTGRTRGLALRLYLHGIALIESDLLAEADATAAEMVDLTTEIGDDTCRAYARTVLARIAVHRGDWTAATQHVDTAVRAGEDLSNDYLLADVLRLRGDLHAARERWRDTITSSTTALAHWRRLGSPLEVARTLARLHIAHDAVGEAGTASRYREECEQVLAELALTADSLRLPSHLAARRR